MKIIKFFFSFLRLESPWVSISMAEFDRTTDNDKQDCTDVQVRSYPWLERFVELDSRFWSGSLLRCAYYDRVLSSDGQNGRNWP